MDLYRKNKLIEFKDKLQQLNVQMQAVENILHEQTSLWLEKKNSGKYSEKELKTERDQLLLIEEKRKNIENQIDRMNDMILEYSPKGKEEPKPTPSTIRRAPAAPAKTTSDEDFLLEPMSSGQKKEVPKDLMDFLSDDEPTAAASVETHDPSVQKAILTVGISASGKSTWAKKLVEENPHFVEINRDTFRQEIWQGMFPNKPFSFKDWNFRAWEPLVNRKVDSALAKAKKEGNSVVVSDTNLNDKLRAELEQKLRTIGFQVSTKEFDVDLDEALKRNDTRSETKVDPEVIKKQHELFRQYQQKSKETTAYFRQVLSKIANRNKT